MSNLPPSGEIPRGAIRFNTDSNKPNSMVHMGRVSVKHTKCTDSGDRQPGVEYLWRTTYCCGTIDYEISVPLEMQKILEIYQV